MRTFHKEIRKTRSITLRAIYKAAPQISETTINEYFSNAVKDFKWTTVSHIDHALLSICGNRVGLPPLDHACPASSSDVRNQLADTKGKHIAQLAQLESAHEKDLDWMKDEVRLWRRFAFLLLGVGLILLVCLVFYLGWDVAHPTSGLIRY